ncbi:hypothetical protein RSOLAG1IB_06764 [Rhizoctonia solani AG-1 IB]|uniref:Jacalin-type lectin domain-containing protein n=1 Tax=Thanatephorus cucumeris (strain AG1-IB / isolate 7/3/14) TaxID=1108050 RepID=A0A0B7F958_THACB|nr:hypothetical protein RSOLAG1IB_06764 [Rhizoctonia solani AG-1 IB]
MMLQTESPRNRSIVDAMSRPTDELKNKLLEESDFLRGLAFDGLSGPYKCSHQVAQLRPNALTAIQLNQDVTIEEIYPANEADARSAHFGWPVPSALPARPLAILDPRTQAAPHPSTWVTRRLIVQKWTISIRVEDLVALDSFVEVFEAALKKSTTAGKIQALRGAFAAWGDLIPLAAVVGASMAATGTLSPGRSLTGSVSTFYPPDRGPNIIQMIDQSLDVTGNWDRRFESTIQGGGSQIFSQLGFNAWLSNFTNTDTSPSWEVVKVHHAAPITDLLPESLQQQIQQLLSYVNLISHSPSVGTQTPFGFDGNSLGLRAIKQINIWHNSTAIQDISTVYADGATSGPYGFGRTTEICDSFVLAHGEFVTGYFVWYTVAGIASLQLVKNTNQMSAFYGAQVSAADPSIFNAGGSALLGFSGNCNGQNLLQLQGVWRNDVRVDPYRSISTSTIAFGNATLFNDFQYMINPNTSRISKIRYRSTAGAVAGLQITYSSMQGDNEVHQETPTRGTDAGPTDTWVLEKGELIVRVKGYTSGASVQQLDFLTNKGNTRKFGQESGQSFDLLPPNKDMALYYLLGKSAGQVQSLTIVWGTPPL